MPQWSRRRLLQAGLAAGSMFAPGGLGWVHAQSEGAVRLLRLPKHALVVGNAGYRHVPALVNPVNDARAVAAPLREAGFQVRTLLDATRAQMLQAVEAYVAELAALKSVGLFYFAGHGVQLAWRNFLLPVDASIGRLEDVAAQCVEVGGLMGGIRRAANAMNVVILDACRDNPFGSELGLEQKGLSQMDAPPATLLAYATAPGNLASDGAGANGLYTENLVREMRVREARIEDVFKRVRLGVRLASKGAQIPWESTSLEEDFYFLPPEQLRKLSREEDERAFAEERAQFERARAGRDAALLGAFLRRYPSGRFAELAQLLLERELAAQGEKPVEIASAEGNPNTTGSARANTAFQVGDRYVYRARDLRRGEERTVAQEVTSVSDAEVAFNGGRLLMDALGNAILLPDGRRFTPRQDVPLEYAVGKRWSTRFDVVGGGSGSVDLDFRIAAREKVTVPAGTFDCFRVEGRGYNNSPFREAVEVAVTFWRDPARVRRVIAQEEKRHYRGDMRAWERLELVSFRQG
jgi:Caspase domain